MLRVVKLISATECVAALALFCDTAFVILRICTRRESGFPLSCFEQAAHSFLGLHRRQILHGD
jgi:hypothetical protein